MGAYYILLSVGVSPNVNEEFQKLKDRSLSFIICNLNKELKEIVVEKSSTNTDWGDFLAELPETEVRIHE
jgi:cofilin